VSAPELVRRFRARPDEIAKIRHEVAAFAAEHGGADPSAVALAVTEAVTNAVVHGSWGKHDSAMVVRWSLQDRVFGFSVLDRGPGFDGSGAAMSRRVHPSQNRGRGLYIMHVLMDRVVVDSGLSGTRIVLEKHIDGPGL
jgi:serine/threonine-protein kinase RsbW